jgi:uncharacterized membrane protein
MSARVAYSPPPAPEPPKQFATMLIGIVLIVVGAILVNNGMNTVQASGRLVAGAGLLAAGAILLFAGASRVWPEKPRLDMAFFIAGILLLVASGTQLAEDWSKAAYAIVLILVGIALIAIGIQVARESWKKYKKR